MSEIKKIVLEIGDKEIELTPDEAKELKDVLNNLFGEKDIVYIPKPYPVYHPYPHWWVRYPDRIGDEIKIKCKTEQISL